MAKKFRRMLATTLVMCMLISALPMQALAAEGDTDRVDPPAGATSTTDSSSTTNADGSTTVTETTVTQTPEGGVTSTEGNTTTNVVYQETVTTQTTTDSNGNLVQQIGSTSGSETVTKTETTETTDTKTNTSTSTTKSDVVENKQENTSSKTDTTTQTKSEEVSVGGTLGGTFGDDGKLQQTAAPTLPTAPEGAQNVTSENGKVSWTESTTTKGDPVTGEPTLKQDSETVEGIPVKDTVTAGPETVTNADGSTTTTTTETTTETKTDTTTVTNTETTVTTTTETTTDTTTTVEVEQNRTLDATLTDNGGSSNTDNIEGEQKKEQGTPADAEFTLKTPEEATAIIALANKLKDAETNPLTPEEKESSYLKEAEALLAAAQKNDPVALALLSGTYGTTENVEAPEISDVDVAFEVMDKATGKVTESLDADEVNSDDNAANDVYNTNANFTVVVTQSIVTGKLVVTVKQGDYVVERSWVSDDNLGAPTINDNGTFSYNLLLEDVMLQEGVKVDMNVKLESINATGTNMYVATVEKHFDAPEDTSMESTPSSGNPIPGGVQIQWNEGSNVTKEITLSSGAKITVQIEGNTIKIIGDANKTVEMKSIVVNTPNGALTYTIPGGVLVAGTTYTAQKAQTPAIPVTHSNTNGVQGHTAVHIHASSGLFSNKIPVVVKVIRNGETYFYNGSYKGSTFEFDFLNGTARDLPSDAVIIISDGKTSLSFTNLREHGNGNTNGKGEENYWVDCTANKMDITIDNSGKIPTDSKFATSETTNKTTANKDMQLMFNVNEAVLKTTVQENTTVKTTEDTITKTWDEVTEVTTVKTTTKTTSVNVLKTVREWFFEHDPIYGQPENPVVPPVTPPVARMINVEEEPAPMVFRLNNQNGLEEIPEEPVPLAAPVVTGDNSFLWMAVALMAMFGIVAVNLLEKKRQYETF